MRLNLKPLSGGSGSGEVKVPSMRRKPGVRDATRVMRRRPLPDEAGDKAFSHERAHSHEGACDALYDKRNGAGTD